MYVYMYICIYVLMYICIYVHGSWSCTSNRRLEPVKEQRLIWQSDTVGFLLFPLAVRAGAPNSHANRGEVSSDLTFMPPVGENAHHF